MSKDPTRSLFILLPNILTKNLYFLVARVS